MNTRADGLTSNDFGVANLEHHIPIAQHERSS